MYNNYKIKKYYYYLGEQPKFKQSDREQINMIKSLCSYYIYSLRPHWKHSLHQITFIRDKSFK